MIKPAVNLSEKRVKNYLGDILSSYACGKLLRYQAIDKIINLMGRADKSIFKNEQPDTDSWIDDSIGMTVLERGYVKPSAIPNAPDPDLISYVEKGVFPRWLSILLAVILGIVVGFVILSLIIPMIFKRI